MAFLTPLSPSIDGLLHKETRTAAIVNDNDLGPGCLYVSESSVSWINEAGNGFSLSYPKISLHAISRDASSFPRHCLYVMVDGKMDAGGDGDKNDNDDDDEEDDAVISEIRFVPEDSSSLDTMHQAICDGNVLHPDPDDSFSSEDDENFSPETRGNGYFMVEPDEEEGKCEDMAVDSVDASQFENADEDPLS